MATQKSLPLPRMPLTSTDQPHQSLQRDLSPELTSLLIYARSLFPHHKDTPNTQPTPLRGRGPSFLPDYINPNEMQLKQMKLRLQLTH